MRAAFAEQGHAEQQAEPAQCGDRDDAGAQHGVRIFICGSDFSRDAFDLSSGMVKEASRLKSLPQEKLTRTA
jgi:hypothetical protein